MAILEIKNLYFSYDNKRQVLKDINISFEKNKIYGVYGKSGAGKSTLLSLLAGLETTKKGEIIYEGKDVDQISREKYRSNNVGIIFQSFNLLPQYTALENVILSMNISGIKVNNKKQKALELLESVGIDEAKANRRVLQLSGGEQQRVSIARAISFNSKIVLADEPTGNLDKETEDEIIDILKRLAHIENKCVIVVSHSANIKNNMDEVICLEKGQIKTS